MNSTVRPSGLFGTDLRSQTTLPFRSSSITSRTSTGLKYKWFPREFRCCGLPSSTQRRYVPPHRVVFVLMIQAADRMSMKMSELVEHVSKKPIPPWTKNLLVEVMVCDEEDEDVEVS